MNNGVEEGGEGEERGSGFVIQENQRLLLVTF